MAPPPSTAATSTSGSTTTATGPTCCSSPGSGSDRGLAVPARRPRRPVPHDRLRQPRRRPDPAARRAVLGRHHGRRRRRRAARPRDRRGACRRLLRRQRYRPRTHPPASRAGQEPGAGRHLRPLGHLRAHGGEGWRWQAEAAPSERAFLEGFYTWIYTPRAHEDGMVRPIIDEALEFQYPTSMETMQRTIDVYLAHEDVDRLAEIQVPTLVLTGELDLICPPRHGRVVADGIPGAEFEVWPARPTSRSRRVRRPSTIGLTSSGSRSTPVSTSGPGPPVDDQRDERRAHHDHRPTRLVRCPDLLPAQPSAAAAGAAQRTVGRGCPPPPTGWSSATPPSGAPGRCWPASMRPAYRPGQRPGGCADHHPDPSGAPAGSNGAEPYAKPDRPV